MNNTYREYFIHYDQATEEEVKDAIGHECFFFWKPVAIKELPDGFFSDRLKAMVKTPDAEVIVVASIGAVGDWSAYISWPAIHELKKELFQRISFDEIFHYCIENRTKENTAKHGDKLSKAEAEALFPLIAQHANYRP